MYKEQRKNNLDLHICSLPPALQCTQSRKKEEGSVLPVFEQNFLFSRLACLYSNCSLHYNSQKDTVSLKGYRDEISLNNVSPEFSGIFFISWTMRPRMMRPLDNATLGRRIPWTMRPLDGVSLTDVSRTFGSG